jgi:hypothetical protein
MSMIFPHPIRCSYPYVRWMYDLCMSNTLSDVSFILLSVLATLVCVVR